MHGSGVLGAAGRAHELAGAAPECPGVALRAGGQALGAPRAEGIQLAAADGIDWLLHIDTDELAYPGGAPEFSLQRVLAAYPADVDTVVFPNYESLPERDDVQDPFTEARRPALLQRASLSA